VYTRIAPVTQPSQLNTQSSTGLWINDAVDDMPDLPLGPFARTSDGAIVAVGQTECLTSHDEGISWEHRPLFASDQEMTALDEGALVCTRGGVLVAGCLNGKEMVWTWTDEARDAPGAILPTYAMRSLDGGKTWVDVRKLHDEWTGAVRTMIETRTGRLVFTTMKMLHNPGRHSVLTYASDDEGATWHPSNVIDLGGCGHHGGVTEATICELESGDLLMLLRTNWEQFWKAVSTDGGDHWHPIGPAGIDASCAPGQLLRLHSGRIALFWNRLYPEGKTEYPYVGGDGIWSEVPCINHRGELSVSFSEDEAESWSAPVVLARHPNDEWLSYPYAFEVEPGILWVTAMQGGVRVRMREADMLR